MPYHTGASTGALKQKKMIDDDTMNHTRGNQNRTQLHPKIRTYDTYTRAYNNWYHTVRQHSKLPRQQTVATASKHRQNKGVSQERQFFRSATAATDRHRKPAALLFVAVSRSSMSSCSSKGPETQQHHSKQHGAASSITDC